MVFGLFQPKIKYDAQAGAQKFKASILSTTITERDEMLFSVDNDAHLAKVRECTAALNEHLPTLQNRDKHIAIGFGIAGVALALAAVIPFGLTIAISGVAYGAYFLGGRDDPYNKFNVALEELAHCCDWALSDLSNPTKVKHDDIQAMLATLLPFVTEKDLITIMGSEDEANKLIRALQSLNTQEVLAAPYQLATKDTVNYHLYGYQQGGSLASLGQVLRIYFQTAFTYVCNLMSGALNKPQYTQGMNS